MLEFVDADEQHGELVAAQPCRDVTGTETLSDSVGDRAKQLIAGGVAEAVVDRLEIVDVDEEHADVLSHLRERLLHTRAEEEPVRHARQRVV